MLEEWSSNGPGTGGKLMKHNATRTVRSLKNSTMMVTLGSLLWFAVKPASTNAQITLPTPPRTVVLRGVVFDSLLLQPIGNATVWLPGGSQSTKTADDGRFELDDVPIGRQFVAFSSPGLDSMGLGTLGKNVDVGASNARVALFTPSFRSVWRALCANSVSASKDSGIVWGTVRDAESNTRLNGAGASFTWYDMELNAQKRLDFRALRHDVRTDSTGTYYACGLPSEIKISSEATGTRSASGAIEYVIGDRRLVRVDLLVSTDMVLQKDLNSSTVAEMIAHGTARLRGNVVDSKGKDVVGATVTLASVDTSVKTNASGEFTMLNLPAGSHGLQARQIGFAPATMMVELRPNALTQLTLEMPNPRSLATFNVRSERAAGHDQLDFLSRQKSGMGYVVKERELKNRYDMVSVLQGMPSIQVERDHGEVFFLMQNKKGGQCAPQIYLDKMRSSSAEIQARKTEDFVAVEVYNSEFTVPIGYDGNYCGVILFWTKRNPLW